MNNQQSRTTGKNQINSDWYGSPSNTNFRLTTPELAKSCTDGVLLKQCYKVQVSTTTVTNEESVTTTTTTSTTDVEKHDDNKSKNVILPWLGFGTYKIGKEQTKKAVIQAIEAGYRNIDTAFIYGGETSEGLVGEAIQYCVDKQIIKDREEIFITTKHWRKYHGYDATMECIKKSLRRLNVSYIDLYLMHWPGPAYSTMNRRKDMIAEHGPWYYAAVSNEDEMIQLRAETWRAMEDCVRTGLTRSIGVSNMSIQHLQQLKQSATLWPPSVNQIEFHPLYPQPELLEYCRKEGIIVQAYASLGGQDTGKKQWMELFGTAPRHPLSLDGKPAKLPKIKDSVIDLLHAPPVLALASSYNKTPAQILLRWAIDQGVPVIPKTTSVDRLHENTNLFDFTLSQEQIQQLTTDIQQLMEQQNRNNKAGTNDEVTKRTRLCWRNDPLRHLDFR